MVVDTDEQFDNEYSKQQKAKAQARIDITDAEALMAQEGANEVASIDSCSACASAEWLLGSASLLMMMMVMMIAMMMVMIMMIMMISALLRLASLHVGMPTPAAALSSN